MTSGWSDVDRSPDPGWFVGYLDRIDGRQGRGQWSNFRLLEPRAGHVLLDVGCGTGAAVRSLALVTGRKGLVVGTDTSRTLLREAATRADGTATCFVVADAHALPFREGAFDGCRANRVLQHLQDPVAAVGEMARVAKPGGRLVVCDPDAGMTAIDAADTRTTSAISAFRASERTGPHLGRHALALLRDAGLRDLRVSGTVNVVLSFEAANETMGLRGAAERAAARGVVTPEEAERWIADLEHRDRDGRFLVALVLLTTSGSKAGRAAAGARLERVRARLVQARWIVRRRRAARRR